VDFGIGIALDEENEMGKEFGVWERREGLDRIYPG
jgi:hypothetical protein